MTEAALGLYIIRGDNMFVFIKTQYRRIASPRSKFSPHRFTHIFHSIASNSAVIGELDEGLDAQTDWEQIRADALKPVVH
jgi:hypothetical protein